MKNYSHSSKKQTSRRLGALYFIIAFITLFLGSCGEQQVKIDPSLLNYEKPLGYDWHLSEEMLVNVRQAQEEFCTPNPEFSENEPEVIKYFRKENCLNSTYQNLSYLPVELFGTQKEGTVSIVTKDFSQAVLYEYSYLHRVIPEGEDEQQTKRDKLANELKKELTKLYGKPIKSGYFDQGSQTGFIVSDKKTLPCSFWQEHNIGIILCSQRVVIVDGVEMALSFVDLNNVPMGKQFAKMVGTLDRILTSENNETPKKATSANISYDSVLYSLENWLSSNKFRSCDKNTIPLSEVINIAPDLLELTRDYTNQLEGDELAKKAFEIINEDKLDIGKEERDQFGLYLLHLAAQQGSATAKNEIGYALLFCGMNVKQDIQKSISLFEKSAASGDVHAKVNLAKLHLAQLTDAKDPLYSAIENFRDCAAENNEYCIQALIDLDIYINSDYPKPQFENSRIFE